MKSGAKSKPETAKARAASSQDAELEDEEVREDDEGMMEQGQGQGQGQSQSQSQGMMVNPPNGETETEMDEDEQIPDPLATVSDVFSFADTTRVKVYIGLGSFCAMVSGAVLPAMAWVFSDSFVNLTADVAGDDFLKEIRNLAYTFMVLGVIALVFMTLQATLLETAAGEMTENLKIQWFDALLRQDMAYYDIQDVSGTATILNLNGKRFQKGLGRKLGQGVQFTISMIGGLAFGFWSSWRVSLLVLTVVPFMALSTAFLLKMNQTKTARANSSYAKAGGIVHAAVSSLRTLLALNAIEEIIDAFCQATQEAYEGAVSQVTLFGLANGFVMGSFLLGYLPVTLYGSYLLYDQVQTEGCDPSGAVVNNVECDPAAFGVFGALMGITFAGAVLPQVSATLEAFTGAQSACYPALMAIRRRRRGEEEEDGGNDAPSKDKDPATVVDKNMRRGSTAPLPEYVIDSSSNEGLKPKDVQGNISFDNITFAYPTRQEQNVFDGFTLTVPAGKTVALCGPSGGGKSTVVQLLERFYDPTQGSITLDGKNLKDLNVSWLRQQIGLVSQEPKLFAMSILDNIKIGCPDATQEQVEAAAKKANAHDFIISFDKGYDTPAGDEGAQLSGGQKQRIAIARVLINQPKIILLDEATSALDSESEAIVQEALDNLMKEGNQTVIVIAHRLSTIRNADIIAVVSGGKIVETGSHAELLQQEGAYHGLIEAQTGGKSTTKKEESIDSTDDSSAPSSRRSSMADDEANETEVEAQLENKHVLDFHHVHFHYPSRPEQKIFRGLDLSVDEGETLALVGPSGQGKSTVIQLIESFYHPTHGHVKYKGVDLKDLNVKWYRGEIGLVSQEPVLFDTTIKENICYGMHEATQGEIEAAAKEANAHDFIISFPDGYDTNVGAGSNQISGGQKQRIAIARALLRKPKVLLLDEATSALDSESERVVQEALDKIMADKSKTIVVIAHRLSTIRNADRIAVINHGKVREIGTHDELMAMPDGHYRRLQSLQSLDEKVDRLKMAATTDKIRDSIMNMSGITGSLPKLEDNSETDKEGEKATSKKARLLSKGDERYFVIGSIGAVLAGLMFPGWGFVFAYMIELLYRPVLFCDDGDVPPPEPFEDCQQYYDQTADEMQALSYKVAYGLLAIVFSAVVGHTLLHYGFGTAVERMNKRVRDAAFKNLVRQEISYFDVRPVGMITTQLSDDAALIHSFSGEPIRTLILNLASVLVGLIVSFYYMWPFALMTLGVLPFMAFGAEAEMQMYMGDDEGDDHKDDDQSSAGIVVESLLHIRTVASLSLEPRRKKAFIDALKHEDPTPMRSNAIKGSTSGLGQFVQMWGIALMFWWGGWLLLNYPNKYGFQDFLISMFSLLFSLNGMGVAMQGATDREKAKAAADRIFELIERESEIDPLSEKGKKDV